MAADRVYTSTVDGVTQQHATPGGAADRRFAKSRAWRLTHEDRDDGRGLVVLDPAAAARRTGRILDAPVPPGEPGTFDDPEGAPALSEFDAIEHESEGTGEPGEGTEAPADGGLSEPISRE